ncbi:outer membrane protein assembly factor BamE [Aliidiomarina halalkaliphila]|uniref:Outer membrane protein assembly factor BamE n=1 Tax=Aliidiomarina halalkaliphila TaxID=2593535 RepID=A0A552X320_9GAMM|nr:outer membrane protein assembly factor BamE [Aliidiomarina halalkaliphila]TRW49375.1 outer membrane protein assembly factor BamE [Aliidiomarina halalkaliphila]
MRIITALALAFALTNCAVFDPLVYKIDIPQGNYMEQQDIDQLRIGMTKEQVRFVLGSPVAENAYRSGEWHYVFRLKPGRGSVTSRQLTVYFENDLVARLSGDFDTPEDFYTPLDD